MKCFIIRGKSTRAKKAINTFQYFFLELFLNFTYKGSFFKPTSFSALLAGMP